jgi:beta-glucosidase
VRDGRVQESRLDVSVRRLLRDKFRLGLFDDPYVDVDAAEEVVGRAEFRARGELAQRRSIVLLKNDSILPLEGRPRIYVEGIASKVAAEYGEVVPIEEAELAILRLATPFEQRPGFLEGMFHAGDLDFKEPELGRILAVLDRVPTVVAIQLDRPAVIPEIAERARGLVAAFGASDAAVLDVVFGRFAPEGRLPFELPSSMDAVRGQAEDVPYDSEDPLFPFGFGLGYDRPAVNPSSAASTSTGSVSRL